MQVHHLRIDSDHEKIQAGVRRRAGTWILARNSVVCDTQRRLRDRVRRTDLGFAAPFLPLGVSDSLAGALELALASAVCLTGRANGDPPGYQTVCMVRHLSSLSGVLTCTCCSHNLVTAASTSAARTFVRTLSPTLNGFLTNREFESPWNSLTPGCVTKEENPTLSVTLSELTSARRRAPGLLRR